MGYLAGNGDADIYRVGMIDMMPFSPSWVPQNNTYFIVTWEKDKKKNLLNEGTNYGWSFRELNHFKFS